MLLDLVGRTYLAHALMLDLYMALMTEFIQVMILSFEVRGGHVLQHQGDAVLAYWPQDHLLQAASAGLETHDRARRISLASMLGIHLTVRVGMASGEVITGLVGGQLSAYGLPVNYARRLCDAAKPGETLICSSMASAIEHSSWPIGHIEPSPPLALAGFGTECSAYRLQSSSISTPQPTRMKVD